MSTFEDVIPDLEVSFENLTQDLAKRGKSRYLEQFRNSKIMQDIVDKISLETQELYDAVLGVLEGRTLKKAEGVQLDRIGYLVGQPRSATNAKLVDYFTPFLNEDEETLEKFAVDEAKVWVKNGRLFEDAALEDADYKKLILSKIYKNHEKGASLPHVRLMGSYIAGVLITLVKTGLQSYQIGVLSKSSTDGQPALEEPYTFLYILRAKWSDTRVDNYYALPIPSTVLLENDMIIFPQDSEGKPTAFAPDMEYGKPDYAKAAISLNIGGLYE